MASVSCHLKIINSAEHMQLISQVILYSVSAFFPDRYITRTNATKLIQEVVFECHIVII